MSVVVVGISSDGSIAYTSGVSPAAERGGSKPAQWIGVKAWDVVIESHRQKARMAFAECLLTGSPTYMEMSTVIGGEVEHWRVDYHRVEHPIAVIAISRKTEAEGTSTLTSRETEIVRLMVRDTSISEMAQTLGVSESTITSHLQNIRHKLGLHTNYGIAAWGVRAGI